MPYEMIWEDRGVYRRYYGHTTDLEVRMSENEVHSSPKFDELRYAILDFRDVTGYEVISSSFIEETAAVVSAAAISNSGIKVAIVAVDPGIVKLAEEYSAHELTPYPTQICATMAEARKWVSVNHPQAKHARKLR